MMKLRTYAAPALILTLLCGQLMPDAAGAEASPDFKEVYDLIRAELPGMSDADMNKAAVQGLISALSPRVSLKSGSGGADEAAEALISKTNLFESGVAYLRVAKVSAGLAGAVEASFRQMASSNRLKGLVIDLRYATGGDYAAAAKTADLFSKKERPLLDWGKGMVQASAKEQVLASPMAVLVNKETSGAAEALAGAIRETGAGLILGARTAGLAMATREFPLKSGGVLQVATGPVRLGDGSVLSEQGVKPDIAVEVSPAAEKAYFADAFKLLSPAGANTNSAALNRRARFNEADLVRERRDSGAGENGDSQAGTEAEKPVVRDPVLARALDLIKGLAIVRQSRS
jgi:hypothetical protein